MSSKKTCPGLRLALARELRLTFVFGAPRAPSCGAAQHPYPADVPTVSVAGEAAKTSLLRPSRWLLARSAGGGPLDRGAKNDGAVPVRSMRLPGSTVVRLVGDHLSFTMDRTRGLGARLPGAPHDAGAVIVTSVALGLRIPDARARPPSTPRAR